MSDLLLPFPLQKPGDIESEIERIGVRNVLMKILTERKPGPPMWPKGEDFGCGPGEPIALPSWLSEEDLDYYTSKFEKRGFTGGLNYYRAMDLYVTCHIYFPMVHWYYSASSFMEKNHERVFSIKAPCPHQICVDGRVDVVECVGVISILI